jgi:cell division protein FtsB
MTCIFNTISEIMYYMEMILQYLYQYQESSLLWSFSIFFTSIFSEIKFILSYPYTLGKKLYRSFIQEDKINAIKQENETMNYAVKVQEAKINVSKQEYYRVNHVMNISKINEVTAKAVLGVTMLGVKRGITVNNTFKKENYILKEENDALKKDVVKLKDECTKLKDRCTTLEKGDTKLKLENDKLKNEYLRISVLNQEVQTMNINLSKINNDFKLEVSKLNQENNELSELISKDYANMTMYCKELNTLVEQLKLHYSIIRDLALVKSDHLEVLTRYDKKQVELREIITKSEYTVLQMSRTLQQKKDPLDKPVVDDTRRKRKQLIDDIDTYGKTVLENSEYMATIHKKMSLNCTELENEYKKYESKLLELNHKLKTFLPQSSNSSIHHQEEKNSSTTSNTSVVHHLKSEDLVPQQSGNNPSTISSTEKNTKAALDANDAEVVQAFKSIFNYKPGAIPKREDTSNPLPVKDALKKYVFNSSNKRTSTATPQHSESLSKKGSSEELSITKSQIPQVDKELAKEIIIKKNDPLLTNISQDIDHTHLSTSSAKTELLSTIFKDVTDV